MSTSKLKNNTLQTFKISFKLIWKDVPSKESAKSYFAVGMASLAEERKSIARNPYIPLTFLQGHLREITIPAIGILASICIATLVTQ